MPGPDTVYIVDDDPASRALMVSVVEELPHVCASFDSVEAFLKALPDDPTGCVVLDVRLPGMSGPDLQVELAGCRHALQIIFVTGFADVRMVVNSMRLGAVDIIEKPFRPDHLLESVEHAMGKARRLREDRNLEAKLAARFARLTAREYEVVKLVSNGLTNCAIAVQLSVSSQAIDARRNKAMAKLQVQCLAELIQTNMRFESSAGDSRSSEGARLATPSS
jgi:FixJ family two-component response regulator